MSEKFSDNFYDEGKNFHLKNSEKNAKRAVFMGQFIEFLCAWNIYPSKISFLYIFHMNYCQKNISSLVKFRQEKISDNSEFRMVIIFRQKNVLKFYVMREKYCTGVMKSSPIQFFHLCWKQNLLGTVLANLPMSRELQRCYESLSPRTTK